MADRQARLPPLDYLLAFEAAALHGGFTAAGKHLNLSQAAISRKIQLLEHYLGRQLFQRDHRSVTLTPAGTRYLFSVHQALEEIRVATGAFTQSDRSARVTIAATQSVATLWLMPRMGRLRTEHPQTVIGLVASDDDQECLSSGADLIILRGDGDWPGFDAELLLEEEIFPVCSPGFAEANSITRITDLLHCTLIETASHHDEWMTWRAWLRRVGVHDAPTPHPLTFNAYALSVQAACDGLGAALGWRHLADAQLASKALVRLLPESVKTGSGYYLLRSRTAPASSLAPKLRDWLLASV